MDIVLKQIVDKISSYNIFNNLYPGIVFCYILKFIFKISILTDNWFENLVVFYFVGMTLSRIGSILIEPLMRNIRIKNKSLIKYTSYDDYECASKKDSIIVTLSEVNNTYRTMLSCFVCAFIYKICSLINSLLIRIGCDFFQKSKDWFFLIFFILLFALSYIKQTGYVKKRVDSLMKRMGYNK